MPRETAPQELIDRADARATARRAGDWTTADRLKTEIEAAGWRVIDAASLYTLERAALADLDDGGVIRYGSSASVPSRLDDAATGVATVVLVATDDPEDLSGAIRGLLEHAPDRTQLVIVANAPSDAQAAALAGLSAEVVWTSTRLGVAAAWNAGIRRAAAPVVILLGPGTEPRGDLVGAIVAGLADERVAVAGPVGLLSDDLRAFTEVAGDRVEVDAIGGAAIGFRRADYVARGPLDEHFSYADSLDVWWSLVLRDPWADLDDAEDEGEDQGEDPVVVDLSDLPVPRRALCVAADVGRRDRGVPTAADARAAKKNFYRVLKRFATRRDLVIPKP